MIFSYIKTSHLHKLQSVSFQMVSRILHFLVSCPELQAVRFEYCMSFYVKIERKGADPVYKHIQIHTQLRVLSRLKQSLHCDKYSWYTHCTYSMYTALWQSLTVLFQTRTHTDTHSGTHSHVSLYTSTGLLASPGIVDMWKQA